MKFEIHSVDNCCSPFFFWLFFLNCAMGISLYYSNEENKEDIGDEKKKAK